MLDDLGKLSEPITKLVEVVSNAVGAVYEPTRIRRRAKAEADTALIAAAGREAVSTLERRSRARVAAVEARRQRNIESVVRGAADLLPSSVSREPVDEDWVIAFFEQCQDVSNDQMQTLWSRILSGEVTKPGSFSLRTLAAVKTLSRHDADLFSRFCAFVWLTPDGPLPVIEDTTTINLGDRGIGLGDLLNLEGIGLLNYQLVTLLTWRTEHSEVDIRYYHWHHLVSSPLRPLEIPTQVVLTGVGAELAPIAGGLPCEEYPSRGRGEVERNWFTGDRAARSELIASGGAKVPIDDVCCALPSSPSGEGCARTSVVRACANLTARRIHLRSCVIRSSSVPRRSVQMRALNLQGSGACSRKGVEVQILSSAPFDSVASLPRSWQAT